MRFAWQGLQFQHPEEFAPVAMSGDRRSGYARLESAEKRIQIRWDQALGEPHLSLKRYFDILSRDAKKAKSSFEGSSNDDLSYRIKAPYVARGFVRDYGDRRLIFEVSGSIKLFEEMASSIDFEEGRWALFGLDIRVPEVLALHKAELQAGRTMLNLRAKGVEVEAERWALADRLLRDKSLGEWLLARYGAPKATFAQTDEGVSVEKGGLNPWNAIGVLDESRNQIVCVKSTTRRLQYRPQWDWIVSSPADPRR